MKPLSMVLIGVCIVPFRVFAACEVPGYDFLYEARDKGLVYEASVAEGDGGCSIIIPSVVVTASTKGKGVVCDVSYFVGEDLEGGWKVKNIIFSGPLLTVVKKSWPGAGMETLVRARVGAGESKSLTINKVVLENSEVDCREWRGSL